MIEIFHPAVGLAGPDELRQGFGQQAEFRLLGFEGILLLPAIGDVIVNPDPFTDAAIVVENGRRVDRACAVGAIVPAEPMFEQKRPSVGDAASPFLDGGLRVLRMDAR